MCWNADVSLKTFIFSTIPLILCLYYKLINIKQYLIFQTFVSIQLVEYFLWTNLNHKGWNRFFSVIGFIVIFLLPAFTIYGGQNKYTKNVLALYFITYLYILFTIPIDFSTSIAPNKHLLWNWLKMPLYIIILWTLFFMYSSIYSIYLGDYTDINIVFFVALTYIITFYSYYTSNTFGTMWCWVANLISVYFYYLLFNHLY